MEDRIQTAVEGLVNIPPESSALLAMLFAIVVICLTFFDWIFWRRSKIKFKGKTDNIQKLTLNLDDSIVDVRVHQNLFVDGKLGLRKGKTYKISHLKEKKAGKFIVVGSDIKVLKSKTKDASKGKIELPARVLEKLDPYREFEHGKEADFYFEMSELKGFSRFWNHEDDATQFNNRLTVRLMFIVLFAELGFGFLPDNMRLILLGLLCFFIFILFIKNR